MSDFAVAAVALTAFLFVVWAAVRAYNAHSPSRATITRWRLDERSRDGVVSVYATRAGDEPLLIGSVPVTAADFEYRIEELRAEAHAKLTALNSATGLTAR